MARAPVCPPPPHVQETSKRTLLDNQVTQLEAAEKQRADMDLPPAQPGGVPQSMLHMSCVPCVCRVCVTCVCPVCALCVLCVPPRVSRRVLCFVLCLRGVGDGWGG
jgi:hypothetical protein